VVSPELFPEPLLEEWLRRIPTLKIGVIGDLFLDRYLDLDATLTEPSIETGLDAYQVTQVRAYPGAAGTVVNNLAALGVGTIYPIAIIGDDGEGYELRQALAKLPGVDPSFVYALPGRRTPTYTKPMLCVLGETPCELNRLDIHNRMPLPKDAVAKVIAALEQCWEHLDGLVVLDQVSLPDCGVITVDVRQRLAELGRATPTRPVLADSRERIGLFTCVHIKPNAREAQLAWPAETLVETIVGLQTHAKRTVYCTRGEQGILVAEEGTCAEVPGYPVTGQVDPVGAGDSTSAGIICALACGATSTQAAAFGNLIASITVQQLGTTGTATPAQARQRFADVASILNR
jgi:bifunctional ADP-heptose synthase (sugar kinase/adenylyltransferase)